MLHLQLLSILSLTGNPSVIINATTAQTGSWVHVSFKEALEARGVDLATLPEMRTVWRVDEGKVGFVEHGNHAESGCVVEPSANATSYWLGQFSPAVTSADDVRMTTSPQSRAGTSSEGTPPYTMPAPAKFISGTQLAKGEYDFKLTNMRDTTNWVLFAGSLVTAAGFEVVSISPAVTFTDADQPSHVRLARTSSVDEMRVSWTSSTKSASSAMTVQWGPKKASLDSKQTATSSTYASTDLCGMPANNSGFHHPGIFWTAVLPLATTSAAEREARSSAAGLVYYYRVGSDEFGWSAVHSFKAPQPVNPNTPMTIIVTADMGETYEDGSQYHWEEPSAVNTTVGMARLAAAQDGGHVDVILHPGDLAYATGYESEWDRFMAQISMTAAQAPYMTGQGNHERDFGTSGNSIGAGDSGGECGVPTQARFQMPVCPQPNTSPCLGAKASSAPPALEFGAGAVAGSGPVGSGNDGWYSFEQGSVHFIMVNTEMSSLNASRQHQFLDADLAAVDRSKTPWIFIHGHRQMYSGNMMAPGNDMGDIEPLLLKYKVDIALWGHIHFAQASCPMFRAKCVTTKDAAGYDAPIHAVVGNAGQSLTAVPAPKDAAPWSIWNDQHWGFSHITVSNATHLKMDFYRDAPLGTANDIYHSFEINRAFPRV